MTRVLVVFGTRPEAIKLAPVIRQLAADPSKFEVKTCVTGQHRQMLDQVLGIFDLSPDYDLNIMAPDQSLFQSASRCFLGIEPVLKKENPHIVLVQGDTTSAFVVGLASYYMKIPVAHVEAGLRTNRRYQPFPEEVNRRLISVLADLHFAPTDTARQNLIRDGINEAGIYVTGNTVIDALLETVKRLEGEQERRQRIISAFPLLETLEQERVILVTCHRRESFGRDLENISCALSEITNRNQDIHILFPVHLNPNVQKTVHAILGRNEHADRIHLLPPLDYESFVYAMSLSHLILTDSGGIQEEAPSLGKPVLVLRDTTERPEGIKAGTAKLIGTGKDRIIEETQRLLTDKDEYRKMTKAKNPYGDGLASQRICAALYTYAGKQR